MNKETSKNSQSEVQPSRSLAGGPERSICLTESIKGESTVPREMTVFLSGDNLDYRRTKLV